MISSRCSPLRLMVWAASQALRAGVGVSQQNVGKSENRRHGRANLVAHVGEKFALARGCAASAVWMASSSWLRVAAGGSFAMGTRKK